MDDILCDLHGILVGSCPGRCLCVYQFVYNGGYIGRLKFPGDRNSGRGAILLGKCQFTSGGMAVEGI